MLKLIQTGNALPFSYPVDITSTFQPGQIGQLKLVGQDIVIGLSDGTAPLGIIDDVRSNSFTQSVVDEVVIIPGSDIYTDGYGNFFTGADATQNLANAGLLQSSFVSDFEGLELNIINGILTIPEDTQLNFDSDGDGLEDSVKTIVSYVYLVPSLPGDDTTMGSNRMTVWFQRGIFATDLFDTTQRYPLNATLFVNEEGKLTTRQATADHPGVAMVTGPPNALQGTLEFLWL